MKKLLGIILVGLLIIGLTACGSNNKNAQQYSTPEEAIENSLGLYGKDRGIGVVNIKQNQSKYIVTYNLQPTSQKNFLIDVGLIISGGMEKIYKSNNKVDYINFIINEPFKDDYGNVTWKSVLSFDVDRNLYNKINWDNFDKRYLLKVVYDIKTLN